MEGRKRGTHIGRREEGTYSVISPNSMLMIEDSREGFLESRELRMETFVRCVSPQSMVPIVSA